MPPTPELFGQLGISLLLGLLVGLQREHAAAMAGLRTFPLITLLGSVAAMLGLEFGGWVVAAGWIGVLGILVTAKLLKIKQADFSHGTTTDAAVLLMFGVGALLVVGPMVVAVAIGGGVAVLLQFKPELHDFSRRLGDADLRAIMQFVLITCIILPVLPNKTYGPLDVLNPREIWLMVVLIVGMSLGGYITYKFLGRNARILLGGFLGGAISSTATTASYSRRAGGDSLGLSAAAVVILIASTVVFGRVLIEIA
ncbi:MAG TPA: MgtC/SapB family protein, partial [Planctomycetaceae bacterium]|nr:MgtC/SapB family protein [Planctomycetaceae bacterium]